MTGTTIDINRGGLATRKVFALLFIIEAITLAVMLWGDYQTWGFYFGALLLPLFIILVPKEPVMGIPLMLVATGFDFFGQVTRQAYLYTLTYFHIVMVITFLSVFMNGCIRGRLTIPTCSMWAPFLAFLSMIGLSLIYTPMFREGFMELLRLASMGALILAVMLCIDSRRRAIFIAWSYILVPTGVAGFTIYEILTQGAFYKAQVIRVATELGLPVYRSTGTFSNPNELAQFIIIGIIVGFALLFARDMKPGIRVFIGFCVILISAAMVATFSRGGWVATAAGVGMVILLHRRWSYFFIAVGIGFIVLVGLAIKYPEIVLSSLGRLLTIFDPSSEASSSSRFSLARSGIWMWQDHPILGVGAAGYSYYLASYLDPEMPRQLLHVILPHTIQIKILAEEGLLGLILASWFFFTIVFDGIRSLREIPDGFLRSTQIGLVALLVGFMVGFTVNSDLFHNIFYITIGMLYAIIFLNRSEQSGLTTEPVETAQQSAPDIAPN